MSQNQHDSFEPIASIWMYVFFIFFLLAITTIGYGSYRLLSEPATYANENWEKNKQLAKDTSVVDTTPTIPTDTTLPKSDTPVESPTVSTSGTTASTDPTTAPQTLTLKQELTALQAKNIVLKQGDKGADVATIQKFFNQYYKTTTKVDSDFGASLVTTVKKFQASQKFPTTGQIGPKTIAAMVSLAK